MSMDMMPAGDDSLELDDDDLLMPHEREMRAALGQMLMALEQQNQLLMIIAQRLGPKRVIRDQAGRIVGAEPAE